MKTRNDSRIDSFIFENGNAVTPKAYNGLVVGNIYALPGVNINNAVIEVINLDEEYILLNVVGTNTYILGKGAVSEYRNVLYLENVIFRNDFENGFSEETIDAEIKKITEKPCGAITAILNDMKLKSLEKMSELYRS